jgi:hypothetical protein
VRTSWQQWRPRLNKTGPRKIRRQGLLESLKKSISFYGLSPDSLLLDLTSDNAINKSVRRKSQKRRKKRYNE